ncbi:energy transducer TonB [Peristeroidobacter agariperforans]|uniref:hypothetical protein n=1 Tax=Peristeroidobacter agariperforans TaxID=268404 RepID=UPI00101C5C89|nr:hypothetical protein [Peristeroidobacter agariperforans]
MNFAPYHIRRHLGFAVLLAGAIALSGCQTAPSKGSSKGTIRILQSEPLKVPDNCEASGSYFVEFTVMSDGSTDDIKASSGPACIQEALAAWVSSFRYEAPGQEIPSGVEWMMVTAQKGS